MTPRPSVRWPLPTLLLALAFAFAAVLAPAARADETGTPSAAEPGAAVVDPLPGEPPPEPPPTPVDSTPPPEAQPEPAPEPAPAPAPDPTPAADPPPVSQPPAGKEPPATVTEKGAGNEGRSAPAQSPASAAPAALTTFTAAAPVPVPEAVPADPLAQTAAPLGWDVYDDTLLADRADGDGGAGGFGGPSSGPFTGIGALAAVGTAAERRKPGHARPSSEAEAVSNDGAGGGGPGPGQGPSLGLFGGGGGAGAGIALLTLLGLACGWFLMPPDPKRAFLCSMATWRPSAYVPPIEHPG